MEGDRIDEKEIENKHPENSKSESNKAYYSLYNYGCLVVMQILCLD